MKSKLYTRGPVKYKAYIKPAGKGYEVGFLWGTKPLFVGNFINQKEATTWYQMMNHEYARFSRKYAHTPTKGTGLAFYNKFVGSSLYKHYYDYLDKCFGKHTRTFHREFSKGVQQYNRLKKHWPTKDTQTFTRRVA